MYNLIYKSTISNQNSKYKPITIHKIITSLLLLLLRLRVGLLWIAENSWLAFYFLLVPACHHCFTEFPPYCPLTLLAHPFTLLILEHLEFANLHSNYHFIPVLFWIDTKLSLSLFSCFHGRILWSHLFL